MFPTDFGAGSYEFGDVAGDTDTAPITDKEMQQAHELIRFSVMNKYPTLSKAFRAIDENKSNMVSQRAFSLCKGPLPLQPDLQLHRLAYCTP